MTEAEYIHATTLANVRAALRLLRDCGPPELVPEEARGFWQVAIRRTQQAHDVLADTLPRTPEPTEGGA